MNILITGGTGFIGRYLIEKLLSRGDKVTVLCRSIEKAQQLFGHQVALVNNLNTLSEPIDAVINLAGEPIMDKPWTQLRKQQLLGSRVDVTRHLVKWLSLQTQKPKTLVSGSAIGFYGNHPEGVPLHEQAESRDCFPAKLCREWEFEALKAKTLGVRVCLLRTGVVLAKDAGALQKMWQPFALGLGGNVASGKQWLSWIHIEDMVALIVFLIDNDSVEGAVNATATEPVRYEMFTRAFAKVLARPHLFPMPAFVLKLLFGESSQLLTEGQRVVPRVLQKSGFDFQFNTIDQALYDIANN